ncbi:hypothetical protein GTW43_32675, partial [Streptomyces sp. SID5785]|uniref:hypothetical protein n=1 Tax=Streptomyces sp. SID5785 TaxID=2690309 RepID=UPI00136183DB
MNNSEAAPDQPGTGTGDVDWRTLRGRRVTLDDGWRYDEDERPARATRHQGVVGDVEDHDGAGPVELTLTRYDGRSLVLCPVGRFEVRDDDTDVVVHTPAEPVVRTIPAGFVEAVRHVAPEHWEELSWLPGAPADTVLPEQAERLVEIAA